MKTMMQIGRRLWNDDHGAVISSEIVLVGSLLVTGMVVGATALRDTVVTEMADVAAAIGALDQSYCYSGIVGHCARTAGSAFVDRQDLVDTGVAVTGHTWVCADVFPSAVPIPPVAPPPVCECKPFSTVTTVTVNTQFVPMPCNQVAVQPLPCGHPCGQGVYNGIPGQGCRVLGCRYGWNGAVGLPEGAYSGPTIAFTPPAALSGPGVAPGVAEGAGLTLRDVSDDGLKASLANQPNLQGLYIVSDKLTDAGLAHLAGLKNLIELSITNAKVTDAGLEQLKALPQLRVLVLQNTQVTDAGLKKFNQDRPTLQIVK